jgi:adenylate cyclase
VPEEVWIDAVLLDPASERADERRQLLAWLEAQGFSVDQLSTACAEGNLHSAAGDRRLRRPPTMTREDVADRTGMTPDEVDRAWLAAGFPPPAAGVPMFDEGDLALLSVVPAASAMFGTDTLLAFTRVMGAAMARIAEAADAMFLTDVEAPRRAGGISELELALTVDEGVRLLLGIPDILEPLFRRHAIAAIDRSRMARAGAGGDDFVGAYRVPRVVAFADLVGFTALSEQLPPRRLAAAVGRFERDASDRAVAADARVVKSIGDAVMLVGSDAVALVDVATALAADVAADPDLAGLRAAVVAGDVLAREGDYVGPTVNLAARATKEAPPGGVVVNDAVAERLAAAGRVTTALEPRPLRGIGDRVVLHLVAEG